MANGKSPQWMQLRPSWFVALHTIDLTSHYTVKDNYYSGEGGGKRGCGLRLRAPAQMLTCPLCRGPRCVLAARSQAHPHGAVLPKGTVAALVPSWKCNCSEKKKSA